MSQNPLAESIEDIEVAYEYMLAYAAQGRKTILRGLPDRLTDKRGRNQD